MEMRSISREAVRALRSPYLDGGYKTDLLQLDELYRGADALRGVFSVPEFFTPSDGTFHFTLLLAFVGVAQLGVIHAHLDNGLETKESEVLITHLDLRCRRAISDTSGISIALTQRSRRERLGAVWYRGDINVQDGAFVGEGAFWFPLPATEASAPRIAISATEEETL